jgi:hypothetical protein
MLWSLWCSALRRVNARVIGVLMNRVPARGGGYYYGYYRYQSYVHSGNGRDGRSAEAKSSPLAVVLRRK